MKKYKKDQVDIITVNYNTAEILPKFFDSIKANSYKNYTLTMVDNASKDNSVSLVKEKYPEVKIIQFDKNYFFCRTNNTAILQTDGEFIFLINTDVIVDKDFLTNAVNTIKSDPEIAAVATKMLLNQNPTIIDSTGTVILDNGEAFNRGIGQPDIGQYDQKAQTFGACFGAVLIRRELLDKIGLLDYNYFGYYDDVDWCYRANLMGYKVIFDPTSVVYHAHSVTARKNTEKKDWKPTKKNYLIRRNFLWTIQKNFEPWQAFKITLVRYRNMIKEAWHMKRLDWLLSNLKVIAVNILTLPRTLYYRFNIQKKRKVRDSEIVKYSTGEMSFFNDQIYSPVYTLDNLEYTFKKKALLDKSYNDIYEKIKELNNTKDPENKKWVKDTQETLNSLRNYLDSQEVDNFIHSILVEKSWFMPAK